MSGAVSGIRISELPAAGAVNLTDQLELNQAGTSRRSAVDQIAAAVASTMPPGAINLRSFGVVGDGVIDDTVEFQKAVTAAGENALYVPPGTYLVSGVDLPSTITIFGAGDASIIKTVSEASTLSFLGDGREIHIRHLKFIGNANTGLLQYPISIEAAKNVSVSDCTFEDIGGRCIRLVYNYDLEVASEHVRITGNRMFNSGDVGVFIKSAVRNCVVSDNVIDTVGAIGGTPNFGVGIVVDDGSGTQEGLASINVVVANNVISNIQGDVTSRAIIVSGGEQVAVCNNIMTDIGSTGPKGCYGIRINRGGLTPDIHPKRVLVSGNVMTNIGSHGIVLYTADQCDVIGNRITNWGCNNDPALSELQSAVFLETSNTGCSIGSNVLVPGAGSDNGVTVNGVDNIGNMVFGNFVGTGLTGDSLHDTGSGTIKVTNRQGQVSDKMPGITLLMHGSCSPTALAATGTQYLTAQGNLAPTATWDVAATTFIDRAMHVWRWRVVLENSPGAGNSRSFTLQRATIDTPIAVTIADTATTATWTGDVALAAGNWIAIETVATGTANATRVSFVMEYSVA